MNELVQIFVNALRRSEQARLVHNDGQLAATPHALKKSREAFLDVPRAPVDDHIRFAVERIFELRGVVTDYANRKLGVRIEDGDAETSETRMMVGETAFPLPLPAGDNFYFAVHAAAA